MSTLVSGIQATGNLHLGNYLGALRQWVDLQGKYNCYYFVADQHALTIQPKSDALRAQIWETTVDLLALGIDPKQVTLFAQSHVPAHSQLGWIINCLIPLGELERMTQFKEKSEQQGKMNAGLLTYPCLMAADILMYRAEVVPVGEDQLQHLELTRIAARKLNAAYKTNFPEPKALLTKQARVMSLVDPKRKMSKSAGAAHYIALRDDAETIRKKISKAVTDGGEGKSDGAKNLLDLLQEFADPMVFQQYKKGADDGSLKYAELKQVLAGAISSYFEGYRQKVKELESKPKYIHEVLADGAKKANAVANKTLAEINEKVGLL
jgi:tryptophanyl-tRNA synthetase